MGKQFTRVSYTTDLHGSERTFRKYANAVKFYKVDVSIMGGDIMGKFLIPIIENQDGSYRTTYGGIQTEITTAEDLQKHMEIIRNLGFYYKKMSYGELERLKGDEKARNEIFEQLARDRLPQWLSHLAEKLDETNVKVYITGGNDDSKDDVKAFAEFIAELKNIERVELLRYHTLSYVWGT